MTVLSTLDRLAHFLYEPALLGRRTARVPNWAKSLHAIHLIPGSLLNRICDAYDRRLEAGDRSGPSSRA